MFDTNLTMTARVWAPEGPLWAPPPRPLVPTLQEFRRMETEQVLGTIMPAIQWEEGGENRCWGLSCLPYSGKREVRTGARDYHACHTVERGR